jgi:hypothetical protein
MSTMDVLRKHTHDRVSFGACRGKTLLPVQLSQVTYSGTAQYDVYDDTNANKFSDEHGANQWQVANPSASGTAQKQGWQDPICFSSGGAMKAVVQFTLPGGALVSASNIRISGSGVSDSGAADDSSGYNFPSTSATVDSTGKIVTSGTMTCSQAFPSSKVSYINPLTVNWEISLDGGNTWSPVKNSTNECFVTLAAPNLRPTVNTDGTPGGPTGQDTNYKLFQTVLYYACSDPGATTANAAVTNTWSLFSKNNGPGNICAWNPADKKYDRKLYYYGAARGFTPPQPISTTALLAATDGDGECYAFGQLFEDALWANGINNNGIKITAISNAAFLVKDFNQSATGSMPAADAPYLWKMTFSAVPPEMQPPPNNATAFGTYGDFVNLATHHGQNTAPPLEKVFGNHYIIQYGSAYYDPSYGVTYASANDFENKSVQGYGLGVPNDNVDLAVEPSSGLHNIQFSNLTIPHE